MFEPEHERPCSARSPRQLLLTPRTVCSSVSLLSLVTSIWPSHSQLLLSRLVRHTQHLIEKRMRHEMSEQKTTPMLTQAGRKDSEPPTAPGQNLSLRPNSCSLETAGPAFLRPRLLGSYVPPIPPPVCRGGSRTHFFQRWAPLVGPASGKLASPFSVHLTIFFS